MRKLKNENYRVMIEPRRLGDLGSVILGDHYMCKDEADRQRQYRERCEQIATEVRRHVAEVGSVCVDCDRVAVCEHCGSQWTEDDDQYNGGCCAKDQEAYDSRAATREPTEGMLKAAEDAVDAASNCESTTDDLSDLAYKAALAAAPQPQAAEPVAWMHPELHRGHPYPEECLTTEAIDGWLPLYTHSAKAQAQPPARTCSDERPCVNCYSGQGECLGPAPETVRQRKEQRAVEIASAISTRPAFSRYESPLILDIVKAALAAQESGR